MTTPSEKRISPTKVKGIQPPTKEVLFLRETWRHAEKKKGLTLVFPTRQAAHSARMKLYAAVRGLQPGMPETDPLLDNARQSFTLLVDKAEPKTLHFVMRKESAIYAAIAEATGLDFDATVDSAVEGSLARVMESQAAQAQAQLQEMNAVSDAITDLPSNPFFTR